MTTKNLTNKQAIAVLDGLWSNPLFGEVHRQAFKIGIEALEQEPCDDAISREAVSKLLNDGWLKGIYPSNEIMTLPPVRPKPRTGQWIEDEYEMKVGCSECGEENDKCSKYCPNCGAKMITTSSEPQESEESDESID